jgi:hypothetical protein
MAEIAGEQVDLACLPEELAVIGRRRRAARLLPSQRT